MLARVPASTIDSLCYTDIGRVCNLYMDIKVRNQDIVRRIEAGELMVNLALEYKLDRCTPSNIYLRTRGYRYHRQPEWVKSRYQRRNKCNAEFVKNHGNTFESFDEPEWKDFGMVVLE